MQARLDQGQPLALAWYCRKIWGSGKMLDMMGSDNWEVEGYRKKTLKELIEEGQLVAYRDASPALRAALVATFY
jgi:hypothetical protein